MKKNKKDLRKKYIIIAIIIASIIFVDQTLKWFVVKTNGFSIIDGVLKFDVFQNNGDMSGNQSNSKAMYIFTNIVILVVVLKFIKAENEFIDMKLRIILSFIFAGGCSNLIDRIFRNYVIEFVDFTAIANIPIFNIADIFIFVGWISFAAIFAAFSFKELNKRKEEKKS